MAKVRGEGRLLIFDGRHLLYRTSDAFSSLSAVVGDEDIGTGGIYGFLSVAIRVHQKYLGQVAIAWEGSRNFRYSLYPDYKKKEKPDQDRLNFLEDMNQQEIRLKALLRAIGVKQYTACNCEADDVMVALANLHIQRNKGGDVIIYTGDSDLLQAVTLDGRIRVVAPGRKGQSTTYDAKAVEDKHGVPPEGIAHLKALAGDNSDNIPGIRGIGPKTAALLIQRYKTVDDAIDAAKRGDPKWPVHDKFAKSVLEHADEVRLYLRLTKIGHNEICRLIAPKRDKAKVMEYLALYRFRSLMVHPEIQFLMRMGVYEQKI